MLIRINMDGHEDAVPIHHRFESKNVNGHEWHFGHLDPFAFKVGIELVQQQTAMLTVIVLFSNHCFTRNLLPGEVVSEELIWQDDRERRVLDLERYELSKCYLPSLILELPHRHIQFADTKRPNFVIFELPPGQEEASPRRYGVFFEVERDKKRKLRVLLRVQSAYLLDNVSHRLMKAGKISFKTLIKRAYTTKA